MPSKKIKPWPQIVIVVKYMCGNMSQGTTLVNYCYLFKQNVAQKAACNMMVTATTTLHSKEWVSNLKGLSVHSKGEKQLLPSMEEEEVGVEVEEGMGRERKTTLNLLYSFLLMPHSPMTIWNCITDGGNHGWGKSIITVTTPICSVSATC